MSMAWRTLDDSLPVMRVGDYGWLMSPRVLLVGHTRVEPFVGYLEQPEEGCEPNWRTGCSEGWHYSLSEIAYWCPIPVVPTPPVKSTAPCGSGSCAVSTGIHDTSYMRDTDPPGLTFGSGELNANGYWSKPCPTCARAWEAKDGVPVGSYWPWPAE